jgi:hypothetical protein
MKLFGINLSKQVQPQSPPIIVEQKKDDNGFYVGLDIVKETINEERYNYSIGDVMTWGNDNLLPYRLGQLYKVSPIHASICNYKKDYLATNYYFDTSGLSVEEKVNFTVFKKDTISVDDFEDFDDFIKNIATQLILFGNLFISVKKDKRGVIKSIKILDSTRVRVRGDINTFERFGYAYNNDWINKHSYKAIPPFNPNEIQGESILCFQKKGPNYKFYGEPEWYSAYDAIELVANIPFLQKQNILNGVNMSGILTIYDYPRGEEEKNSFKRILQKTLSGLSKSNGLFVTTGTSKDLAPDYKSVAPNANDKIFIQLLEDMEKLACYAHQISPAVIGIPTPGKLGASQEIEFLTAKFEESMNSEKKIISSIVNKLLQLTGNNKVIFKYDIEDIKNNYLK